MFLFTLLLGENRAYDEIDFNSGPKVAYQLLIDQEVLRKDESQFLLVEKLDELFHRIKGYQRHKPGILTKVCCFYFLSKHA